MKELIRALSGKAEFLVVVLGAFGLFLLSNLVLLFDPAVLKEGSAITSDSLRSLIVYELIVLALLSAFLKARNWSRERLGLAPDVRDTIIGVGLTAVVYAITMLIQLIAGHFAPESMEIALRMQRVSGPLDLGTVAIVSVVNSVFEEVFVCAYVITALKDRRGLAYAVNVSVGIRVAYHLYQGAIGALTIAPVGLLFAYWYVRSGRLWPIIVAHALLDFIGLLVEG